MAKVSICDYCKQISKKDFEHHVQLVNEVEDIKVFEICKECFESLQTILDGDTPIPQAIVNTPSEKGSRDSLPSQPVPQYLQEMIRNKSEALLDHEINKVPSRRDEVVKADDACKHKYDMMQDEVGDMYMACVKCDEKMETESIT